MNEPPADNPFALAYSALWDLAMRSRDLAARVKEGNRIRFDAPEKRAPLKPEIAAADTPELALVVRGMGSQLNNTSSTSEVTRNYAWMVSSGDYRYNQIISQVEWSLFCGMAGWRTTLTALKWRDKGFVKRVQMPSGSTGLSDPALNRNILGWTAVWSVDVLMSFDQKDLEDTLFNPLEGQAP